MIPNCRNIYKDITSECTFANCTHDYGKVFVDTERRMVFFNLMITIKTSSDWGRILKLPSKYAPTDIVAASGGGCSITGSVFWASVVSSEDSVVIQGAITAGKQIALQGYYHLKDFLDA